MSGVEFYRPWLDRPCPKCGAESGKSCRTMMTGRSTDTHAVRWQTPPPGERADQ